MAQTAQTIHDLLRNKCGEQVGIAISGGLVQRLFRKSMGRIKGMGFLTAGIAIPERILANGTLLTNISFDETKIDIDFTNERITITGLELILKIDVGTATGRYQLSQTTIKYSQFSATPRLVENTIVLEAEDLTTSLTSEATATAFSADRATVLKDAGAADPAAVAKFDSVEQAIVLIAIRAIRNAFVKAMAIPDVLAVFSGFEIGARSEVFVEEGYLIVKADATPILGRCPMINAKGETRVVPRSDAAGVVSASVNHTPRKLSSDVSPSELTDLINSGNETAMDVYGFFPKKVLEVAFDGPIKPSLTVEKRGDFGPFYYRLSCTAAIKRLTLSVDAIIPPRLLLDVPLGITGQAGAGIEIGCVRYEALGAMWDGEVDPLQVVFELSMDIERGILGLMTKIGDVDAKNFKFRTFPDAPFPISEITEFLLGKGAELAIEGQADSILNITRITLADFSVLDNFTGIRKSISQHGIGGANGSFLAGVLLEL